MQLNPIVIGMVTSCVFVRVCPGVGTRGSCKERDVDQVCRRTNDAAEPLELCTILLEWMVPILAASAG